MTTASAIPPARIPAYDYAAPTEGEALAALQRVFGPARGIDAWTRACGDAGLPMGRLAGAAELERATEALARQGGAAATVARAITIRMRTWSRLAERATRAGGAR